MPENLINLFSYTFIFIHKTSSANGFFPYIKKIQIISFELQNLFQLTLKLNTAIANSNLKKF